MNALSLLIVIIFISAARSQLRETLEKKVSYGAKFNNWIQQRSRTVSGKEMITVRFVLKQDESKIKSFERELIELSTPGNAKYGSWLTREQVKQRLAVSADSVRVVTDYLSAAGVADFKVRKF